MTAVDRPGVVAPIPAGRRPRCPACRALDVARLYLATEQLDSCECRSCGALWEEDPTSGSFYGPGSPRTMATIRPRPGARHTPT